jgi:hypothetical protein
MKFHLLSILAIIIAACSGPKKESVADTVRISSIEKEKFSLPDTIRIGEVVFHLASISEADFKKAKSVHYDSTEQNNLAKDTELVERKGDSLIFKLSNGLSATLVNVKGEGFSAYRYAGRIKSINHYFILGSYDEWSSNYLINEATGDSTEICGLPEISTDNKYLLSGNDDLIAGFSFNGFDLFKNENNSLKRIGKREISGWGPRTIKWINSKEAFVEIRVFETDQSKNRIDYPEYIKLSIE